MPGLVKIGCTKGTPYERARQLSSETGVPEPFMVAWSAQVTDWHAVEALTHDRLALQRPNRNREFFRCSVEEARKAIEKAAHAYLRPWWWKLLFVRRRRPAARYGRPAWRRGRDPLAGRLVVVLVLLVGLVAWLKPDLPPWLPGSVIRAAYLVERLHR